jgi:hypothetical protein
MAPHFHICLVIFLSRSPVFKCARPILRLRIRPQTIAVIPTIELDALRMLPIGMRRTKSNRFPSGRRVSWAALSILAGLSTAYPANPQLAPISRPITPDSSNGSDVVLTGQLPHPACHFKFKKRRKHFRGRKLCLQLFQDSVDLEAVVGAQNLQHHRLLWS